MAERKMKNTALEWLGIIPEQWGIGRIGSLYSVRNQKVSDNDYQPLSVTMKGILPQLETAAKTNAHDDRKLVRKGDFAINSRSDRRGSCGISDYDGSVSLINTVLKPRGDMHPGYYNWLFHTTQFADEFYKWGHGIVDDLWTTGWQEMKKINIPVPTIEEQQKIADFLDSKCSEIDVLSKDIEKEIETLEEYKKSVITEAVTKGLDPNVEMKESGIKWIGNIPKDWKINKIKYVSNEVMESGLMDPDTSKYIGLENVMSYSKQLIETESEYVKSIQKICRKGNVLFGKLRPYLSKVIIAPFDGFCTGEFLELSDYNGDYRFLAYSMLNSNFIDEVNMSTYGTKMPRANSNYVVNMKICNPSIYEQKEISDFLDIKCCEIDGIIKNKRTQLDVLNDYKKSLIYEYVTGKKEVC